MTVMRVVVHHPYAYPLTDRMGHGRIAFWIRHCPVPSGVEWAPTQRALLALGAEATGVLPFPSTLFPFSSFPPPYTSLSPSPYSPLLL